MIDTDVINVTIDRGQHKVLVVDDNAATRYSTSRILRASGFKVAEAASGAEALLLSTQGVSAVILDVHLPDIDGFEVCRTLRAHPVTEMLPVAHLSATHVRDEDRIAGLNAGADAYLVHPVEPAVLVATLQALIRARTAEDQLRRSEQRFRAIYDQAQSGIGLIDSRGIFVETNPTMLRLLGRTPEQLLNVPIEQLAPLDWTTRVAERIASINAGGNESWHGEFPLLTATGRPVYLEWSMSAPIEPGLRIAIVNDASQRYELEQRRRDVLEREQAARSAAEQHNRTKDDFIAVLSHELRTPLNSIVGWVAILMRRNPTPEAVKGLEAIERSVKTQARIISDILDVSRINSGKMTLEIEQTMPASVITNAVASLKGQLDEKSLTVEADLDDGGLTAWLDPGRFQQIFWNLMTNAIKFSHKGGKVRVSMSREGDMLRLVVQDFGQGIDRAFLPQLFDRFTQSDSPGNRRHGGLGLGLSIVKHLVDLHGGTVVAESAGAGHGASMRVEMPVASPPAQSTTQELDEETRRDADDLTPVVDEDAIDFSGQPLSGLNVVIVDDDPGAREILLMVLTDRGAQVRASHDFDSAIEAISHKWPDVLVSDIGLPGRDGYDLIREVRSMQPAGQRLIDRMPAVALTAFARPEDRAKALEAGFDAHLAKPLKPHALVMAILSLRLTQKVAAKKR